MSFNREAKEKEDQLASQVPRVLAEPREIRSVCAGTNTEAQKRMINITHLWTQGAVFTNK